MPTFTRIGLHVLSVAFGLLMVGLAAADANGPARGIAIAAAAAAGVAMAFRPAATLAVAGSVLTILLSEPPYEVVGLSGLCAAGYLVCRHAAGTPGAVVMASWPTVVGAVGFTGAGMVAMFFPLQLPWVPLAAPLVALAIYLLAARPFLG
ncbi:hypothetical protein [Mycobacterium sherrisii]|uniref:Integral membrane protein n=1 Tax=Mycobacterium sherrisii TaxID=243061 RepID=A0A1E3SXA9_9MYCO|nr:hypothetical protein [Mycobacterium sherrisii]MCV7029574.1 hypothetical protein [Mycobacterium sherrisii]MEC4763948.1 hypothetical protein [Mycobacterium sherrisii]ODR06796.1 hypothetical protein BHQ21_10335 [Mycobacterium sherrisii]ORW83607.1 hypothetical protein AWC25_25760 [Mycobacterium sherrisii]